ncbi:hypothetical protein EON80_18240 [bacterium]|nr:MAG: hypothetical protein EON80_18240 [bacterium]
MSIEETRRYKIHETVYALEYFPHLMTEVERAAVDAVLVVGEEDDQTTTQVFFSEEPSDEVAAAAKGALGTDDHAFRRRTAERIVSEHRDEVYANSCPNCGLLPATPSAKVCIWCSHTWFENS